MEATFGMGIYTTSDVANILGLPLNKVSYWFSRYVSGTFENYSKGKYFYDDNKHIAVNFYTLIETYVFYHLRSKGLKSKAIITAHNILSRHYETPYPFALHSFLSSGTDLFHDFGSGDLVVLNETKQIAIKNIITQFAENIDFGERFAQKYYPKGRENSVVINPNNQFGAPIIEGTNIKTSTITSLIRGGESIATVCNLYTITEEQVRDVLDYSNAA